MEYKEIVSVTGEPGLFQLLSSKSDGAIVRSLDGKATRFVPSRNHNFTPLESIEVFTSGENVPLSEVFKTMQEKESTVPVVGAGKDAAAIKGYFEQVYPELDKERVYMSDMKKMLKWYPVLKENDLLKFEDEAGKDESGESGIQEKPEVEEAQAAVSEEKESTVKKKKEAKAAPKDETGPAGNKSKAKKTSPEKAPAKKKAAAKKTGAKDSETSSQ